jgi:creatinine amidohydrolase/Fe(II)-dependent formamide hydrolase-like protein
MSHATAARTPAPQADAPPRARILEWQHLTGAQHAALDPASTIVLVTCSPLEVHGPHLPVAADMAEGDALLVRAVELLGERRPHLTFLRLPSLYLATDVVPQRGSISFDPGTVVRVVEQLGRSLARQGFRHVWVSNFHGGPRHFVALETACARASRRHGIKMLSVFSVMARRITGGSAEVSDFLAGIGGVPKETLVGDAHGGLVETSMLLHILGQHVAEDFTSLPPRSLELSLAEAGRPPVQAGARATLRELVRGFFLKARYFDTETYAGAPAGASAELGRQYLDLFAARTADALAESLDGKLQDADTRTPAYPLRHVLLNRAVGFVVDRFVRQRGHAV